jgi:DNA helicase-2/ATP-dependent DNA helicase PcrA
LAGPGAGKTATLVHRVNHIIKEGVNPDHITAVSFSKVAADELGRRAFEVNQTVNVSRFCTIHALSFRALRSYGETRKVAVGGSKERGFKSKYNVGMLPKIHSSNALEQYGLSEVGWKDFMAFVNSAKANAIRSNMLDNYYYQLLSNAGWNFAGGVVTWAADAHRMLASAHREYDRLMREDKVMTFADMLCEFEWLLEDDKAVLSQQRTVVDHLFIDEAQDTNPQAMRILTNLSQPQDNVSVIGDPDQCVYGFIGAQPEVNMWSGFEQRFPEHETYMLETNYRSTDSIVAFTNLAIAENYDDSTAHYKKSLVPREDAGDGVEVTHEVYATVWEEAQKVSDMVADAIFDDGKEPGDFFIIARTRAQLAYTLMYLFKYKIPAVIKGGISFWELAHIQDLLAYMRLSVDKGNEEAFGRVYRKASSDMRQPYDKFDKVTNQLIIARNTQINHRFLSKEFLKACGGAYTGMGAATQRMWQEGIRDLRQLMVKIDAEEKPSDKADCIIENCLRSWWAIEEGASEDGEGNDRITDLRTIADIASQKDDDGQPLFNSTEAFLEHIDELIEKTREVARGDTSEVVVLSTIHGVKGQERDTVHVLGVMEGLLPHWTVNGTTFSTSVLPTGRSNTVEDERRLFFVAVSRAKEKVYLHGPSMYQNKPLSVSRFAYETKLAGQVVAELVSEALDDILGDDE